MKLVVSQALKNLAQTALTQRPGVAARRELKHEQHLALSMLSM
jgi:hypothetical protein